MPIRTKAAEALRAAMHRLLAGDAGSTDGRLTWANVHGLAGVPKATADRATDVKAEWKQRLAARRAEAKPVTATETDDEHVFRRAETAAGLRQTIRIMADHIQALTLAVEDLEAMVNDRDRIIADLRGDLARATGANIVPLAREARHGAPVDPA